ncbi:hypothetical protein [Streptomyces sp. NPDC026589]|uniref:hypothetical protein n=1 Tax=Streptomyces sp. NPDC026589 TaxID=3155609 RepID=UPI0033E8501C
MRTVRLGGVLAPTRRLALCWLRRQARRFADALDPDPYVPWVPARALYLAPVGGRRDAPAELRSWAGSVREHDYALGRLAEGLPYEFVARDTASWYGLVMRPLTPAPAPAYIPVSVSVPLSSLR